MKRLLSFGLILSLTAALCSLFATALSEYDAAKEGYSLVWADEFEGDSLDFNNWRYEGSLVNRNDEAQVYCDSVEDNNVRVENGNLVIEARPEQRTNIYGRTFEYTSGSITTAGMRSFQYGFMEARIKIPKGRGAFPAFWMLGIDDDGTSVWPRDGEIDIMEYISQEPDTAHATLHFNDEQGEHGSVSISKFKQDGVDDYAGEYHLFSMLWTEDEITMFVDKQKTGTQKLDSPNFDAFKTDSFYFILNLALDGWAEAPDETTPFPMQMLVDYVRVYQNESGKMYSDDSLQKFRGLLLNHKDNTVKGFFAGENAEDFWLQKLYIGGIFDREFAGVKNGRIATGSVLKLRKNDIVREFTCIVAGDITGDGAVSAADMLALKRAVLNIEQPVGVYKSAADMDESGTINAADLLKLKQTVLF